MLRLATGKEVLAQAKAVLASARTKEELREVPAVILPLELGLSKNPATAIHRISRG